MGLNIGIHVKRQREGYGEDGMNPKGTPDEIEADFFDFLDKKFPKGGYGGGWVDLKQGESYLFNGKPYYDFDVRMNGYGSNFQNNGYTMEQMWLAIAEYIFDHFSHMEGIEMQSYWSG